MRMGALMSVLREDQSVKAVYLISPDYSFGQAVQREASGSWRCSAPTCRSRARSCTRCCASRTSRPMPTKIKASGADAVITGNFGNDLTCW